MIEPAFWLVVIVASALLVVAVKASRTDDAAKAKLDALGIPETEPFEIPGADDGDGPPMARRTERKYGVDRYLPEGDWQEVVKGVRVAGTKHRPYALDRWLEAVRRAEAAGLRYGLELQPEPANPYDRNALRVHGVVEDRTKQTWHIGYVPAELAREVAEAMPTGAQLVARLYSIFERANGHTDVNFDLYSTPGAPTLTRPIPEAIL
jgi:hypothetical protein